MTWTKLWSPEGAQLTQGRGLVWGAHSRGTRALREGEKGGWPVSHPQAGPSLHLPSLPLLPGGLCYSLLLSPPGRRQLPSTAQPQSPDPVAIS